MKHKIVVGVFLVLFASLALLSLFATWPVWYLGVLWLIYFTIIMIGSSFIWSNYHVKAYCGNPSVKEKKIALSFDDGPTEFTPKVLELLKEYNVPATFFCIGKNIEKHPDLFKQILANGHDVGNHSYSHSKYFDLYRTPGISEELNQTDALIKQYSGKKPKFFRPPYGVTTPSIRRALKKTGHLTIGWNIRSNDGISRNEKLILNRILNRLKPGGIVLLHDTSASSVNVLEQLLLTLRRLDYEVVPLGQLLNLDAYEK